MSAEVKQFSRKAIPFLLMGAIIALSFTVISFDNDKLNESSDISSLKVSKDFSITSIQINQLNWDEFSVSYEVNKELQKEEIYLYLYNSNNELVGFSENNRMSFNDAATKSLEQLDLVLVVKQGKHTMRYNDQITASEKFVEVKPEFNYPLNNSLFLGNYNLKADVLRKSFKSDDLERIGGSEMIDASLIASAGDEEIVMAIDRRVGEFDLSTHSNYNDFLAVISPQLGYDLSTTINFSLAINLNGSKYMIDPTDKTIAFADPVNHFEVIKEYANVAALKIMRKVDPESGKNPYPMIKDWQFNKDQNQYTITMHTQWVNKWFEEEKYMIGGVLTVNSDGSNPNFQRTFANDAVSYLEQWVGVRLGNSTQFSSVASL